VCAEEDAFAFISSISASGVRAFGERSLVPLVAHFCSASAMINSSCVADMVYVVRVLCVLCVMCVMCVMCDVYVRAACGDVC